jgi:hypothetical protein
MSHSPFASVYLSLHFTTDSLSLSYILGSLLRFLQLAVMDGVLFPFGARICCTDFMFLDLALTGKDDLWIRPVWFIGFSSPVFFSLSI